MGPIRSQSGAEPGGRALDGGRRLLRLREFERHRAQGGTQHRLHLWTSDARVDLQDGRPQWQWPSLVGQAAKAVPNHRLWAVSGRVLERERLGVRCREHPTEARCALHAAACALGDGNHQVDSKGQDQVRHVWAKRALRVPAVQVSCSDGQVLRVYRELGQ